MGRWEIVISLIKLAEEGKIEKTGAKPKLPIKVEGVSSETLDVYRIPLEYLYYNDKNGRISTGIAEYEGEVEPVSDIVSPSYNNLVAKIIESGNKNALKRTQKSIEESGQQVYGWVLDDGRVIDGNRRLTALRNIHQKTGQTVYFEAVVLPFSYNNDSERVKIKQLELAIQMGVEERESYDPVDLAVDIYQTTAGNNPIMTRADYARDSRMRLTEVEKYYHGAIYMKKFLEFIGAPATSYGIIKDSKSWSLFYEMGKVLNKEFGNDSESQVHKNETMESYFGVILYQTHVGVVGNTARTHVRDYGKYIISTADNNDFNEDVQDIVEDLSESIQDAEVVDYTDLTKALTQEDDKISEFGDTYNTYLHAAKNGESVEKFIKSIQEDVKFYQDLNADNGLAGSLQYNQVDSKQLKELQKYMRELNIASKELFEKYGKEYQ
jgi:hypothetical protein